MFKFNYTYLLLFSLLACQVQKEKGLKDYFEGDFVIGAALNPGQVSGDEKGADSLLSLHFNSITPENGLKWVRVHPEEGEFDFQFGDAFVDLGEKLDAFIVGHTLVWHQQTPSWVFQHGEGNFLNEEELMKRMEDHIEMVVGRYKGRIHGWDVVNEAFEDDGSYRKSHWYSISGKEFIKRAFLKANEIDPDVELYYNDYNVWKPEKRKAILELAQEMKAEGIRIDGIGMQGHYRLDFPSVDQIEAAILEISEVGLQVMVTELDVDVLPRPSDSDGADLDLDFTNSPEFNPYQDELPVEVQQKLAERYAELFEVFHRHSDKISRVTFWGLHDGKTWLNNWPVRGRTNYPLLFDREMKLKSGMEEKLKEMTKK